MIDDPIVDEVRKHRQAYAAKFHFNVRAIAADAQREERKSGRPLVSFVKTGRKDECRHPDPIVEGVRRHRQANAAKFGYNIRAIAEDARTREKASGHVVLQPLKGKVGKRARLVGPAAAKTRAIATSKK